MSGNGNLWAGIAFGALTGLAVGTAAYAGSRGCCGYSGYSYFNSCFNVGFSFGGYYSNSYAGCGIGYGRMGWGPNSVVYGPDVFNTLYASPYAMVNANLGYFIA